ncbi:MAG: hypothetical protein G01um10148_902 [Parcubacteria group bacterium Gr01-1014_8]|nr:MAG: hypothetical protein G01um10148_902 [Parcubacteria group bacterium Gr01-1014_8]
MKISAYHIVGFLLAIAALHFGDNALGIYDTQIQNGFVWFDNVLHALVGATLALGLLRWLGKKNTMLSQTFTAITTLHFVLIAATAWELFEYIFFTLFPNYALYLKLYSPSLVEAASDVFSNVFGAAILLIGFAIYKKSQSG